MRPPMYRATPFQITPSRKPEKHRAPMKNLPLKRRDERDEERARQIGYQLSALFKKKSYDEVITIFEHTRPHLLDVLHCNFAVKSYLALHNREDAERLLKEKMPATGIQPNSYILNAFTYAYSHQFNDLPSVYDILEYFRERYPQVFLKIACPCWGFV